MNLNRVNNIAAEESSRVSGVYPIIHACFADAIGVLRKCDRIGMTLKEGCVHINAHEEDKAAQRMGLVGLLVEGNVVDSDFSNLYFVTVKPIGDMHFSRKVGDAIKKVITDYTAEY